MKSLLHLLLLMMALVSTGVVSFAIPSASSSTHRHHGRNNGGRFSVTQVANPNFSPNGPLQLAKVYRKYGVPVPEKLAAAVERHLAVREVSCGGGGGGGGKHQKGSVSAVPLDDDFAYIAPVKIGTPPQTLHLDFDTGSSDFWVFSTELPRDQVNGQTLYSPNKSSTAHKMAGATWEIEYGDMSSSSGDVYIDTVTVGGDGHGATFSSQAVETARQVSEQFSNESRIDGVLGLGFSTINSVSPTPQKTLFENLLPSLDRPVFTFDLKAGRPGTINFGWIDTKAYDTKEPITYLGVDNSDGFWKMDVTGYSIGPVPNYPNTTVIPGRFSGLADTGSSLLLLNGYTVEAFYQHVDGAYFDDETQHAWTFPCNSTLPNLSFSLDRPPKSSQEGGYGKNGTDTNPMITIPGHYLNYAKTTDNDGRCFGALQSSVAIGIPIFGDVMLKTSFVVFENRNGSQARIGWAPKKLE